MNFRKSHQISWTLYDLVKSFKAFWTLLPPLTLCWLGLIKLGIKSNAKTAVTAYTHATIYIHVNLYSGRRWWYGWNNYAKKKKMLKMLESILFFWNNKMCATSTLMPRCPCWDFRMTENKHRVCFLYKKPVRDSVLGKFSTHEIDILLELQNTFFLQIGAYFYYCSWNLVILLAIADISQSNLPYFL